MAVEFEEVFTKSRDRLPERHIPRWPSVTTIIAHNYYKYCQKHWQRQTN